MENEMIERVARALDPILMGAPDGDTITDFQKAGVRKRARAAIEALREPTEGMVDAALDAGEWAPVGEGTIGPAEAWQAMIDAALSEPAK